MNNKFGRIMWHRVILQGIKSAALVAVLLQYQLAAHADDTELFTGANINNNARPQVMILLDTSGSMDYDAPSIPKRPYNPSIIYGGSRNPSSRYTIYWNYELLVDGSPCTPVYFFGTSGTVVGATCPGNYLNWYNQTEFQPPGTRINLAVNAITDLINNNPGVDFGLAAFLNGRDRGRGGYIRRRISPDSSNILNDLNYIDPEGGTPLCGAYYEVLNFFMGRELYRGQLTGSRDTSVEQIPGSRYKTTSEYGDIPVVKPCQNLYIIYVTDGEPSAEFAVNSRVKSDNRLLIDGLTPITSCDNYADNSGGLSENCLPKLAEYLAKPGPGGLDGNIATGNQKAFTYTIGFATDQPLLRETADKGNGVCYTTVGSNIDADTGCVVVNDIASAFQGALGEILQQTSTFVSPAVAVNTFKRTESLDNAYYAMFLPTDSARWKGNLKKLKIYKDDSSPACTDLDDHVPGTVIDRRCDVALDDGSNRIADGRSTYWGTVDDGSDVASGGLGATLLNSRGTFYTNLVNAQNQESIGSLDNIDTSRFNLDGNESFTATDLINWVKGLDSSGNTLDWVLGDILHSRPVTLNYGDTDGSGTEYSENNPDIRLAFGTNYGVLHFIEDQGNNVVENWSFFAGETAGNAAKLYENRDDAGHPYGLDGQISVIRLDYNKDGNIKHTDGDRMILYFGMRRGGSSYYAIDVSNPDGTPTLLWRIDHTMPGFTELGQSWSTPVPVILPGHRELVTTTEGKVTTSSINYKYALAFGAGYDSTNDDDRQGEDFIDAAGDSHKVRKYSQNGRGLFFVDASSGSLIQSFTAPDAIDTANPIQYESSDLKWSVVASPAPMDSNGDGLTDRVYFADTGGNVFRIDIGKAYPDANAPDVETALWSMIKLAELGADETDIRPSPDSIDDRRFMYQPELVRTTYRGRAYDAVVLGSGNRANPMATSNTDRYYVIRDTNIFYNRFGSCNDCTTPPNVISHSSLYDASRNLIQQGTDQQTANGLSLLDSSNGWYINLSASGEKTTTTGDVYSGQLLYSTYAPSSAPGANICTPSIGSSRFYVVDLHTASAIRDVDNDNDKEIHDRFSLFSVVGMPGDATIVSLGKDNGSLDKDRVPLGKDRNLIDLNTGYSGAVNEVGMHRSGWIEQ
ncbi:pilus assembly protein [Endozoicomonas sp. ALE010]|uniref:pilus assembly protein n=1 Tax=Endozoicomonas sp. ALE010 TaxID=3403081 RepID=UPI003BB5C20D